MAKSTAITSLAILKAHWEAQKKDYIENFVPFFVHLIQTKRYPTIDPDVLRGDFVAEFSLEIPFHPTVAILSRLQNRGYMKREYGSYIPDFSRIDEQNFAAVRDQESRKLSKLIKEFIAYCGALNFPLTEDEAAGVLLGFFSETEISFLFGAQQTNILSEPIETKNGKARKDYFVAKFITNIRASEPTLFNYLVDVSIGYALASAILYAEDLKPFEGSFRGLNVYLDTDYLFSLLGINGEAQQESFEELTSSLVQEGTNLKVFTHTYDEFMGILESARHWLTKQASDMHPERGSRAFKHFLESDATASDVELFMASVPGMLGNAKIQIVDKPEYNKDINFQIDEKTFKEEILKEYRSHGFDETGREDTIQKDIQSVYAIFKLRKGHVPVSIKDSRHIFVTRNQSIARLSISVLASPNGYTGIPPCVTDVFMGTMIWLQRPIRAKELNEKKIMAEVYAAVQPSPSIVHKYLLEIEKLKRKKSITPDQYYFLRGSGYARKLLSEKTMGNDDALTPRTPMEILSIINREAVAEVRADLDKERGNIAAIQVDRTLSARKHAQAKSNLKFLAERRAKVVELLTTIIVWGITPCVFVTIAGAVVITVYPDDFSLPLQIIAIVAIVGITWFGISRKVVGDFVNKWVQIFWTKVLKTAFGEIETQ